MVHLGGHGQVRLQVGSGHGMARLFGCKQGADTIHYLFKARSLAAVLVQASLHEVLQPGQGQGKMRERGEVRQRGSQC